MWKVFFGCRLPFLGAATVGAWLVLHSHLYLQFSGFLPRASRRSAKRRGALTGAGVIGVVGNITQPNVITLELSKRLSSPAKGNSAGSGLRASYPPRGPKIFKKPVSVWQIDSAKGKLKPSASWFNAGCTTKHPVPSCFHNIFSVLSLHIKFFFNFLPSNKSSQIW